MNNPIWSFSVPSVTALSIEDKSIGLFHDYAIVFDAEGIARFQVDLD